MNNARSGIKLEIYATLDRNFHITMAIPIVSSLQLLIVWTNH